MYASDSLLALQYLALVYWYRYVRPHPARQTTDRLGRLATFLATLWIIAYVEEMLWDRGVWHERGWLFGGAWDLASFQVVLVPLLAVPQITHYVLDGFIWRRRRNPEFTLVRS